MTIEIFAAAARTKPRSILSLFLEVCVRAINVYFTDLNLEKRWASWVNNVGNFKERPTSSKCFCNSTQVGSFVSDGLAAGRTIFVLCVTVLSS